ncbi:MAG: Nramp family divalent metal transporter [Brooklawnia sp.]|uniref:Nramp family divalent metal transporter n=1 Tax=Brooklawnia sp. TaxID=2699740 RepID=UPI003C706817
MPELIEVQVIPAEAQDDPYVLDPSKIMEPPKGWGPSLRFLGPGMITSAAVVGSGELITATTLGSRVGMVLLWLVFVSTFVKVAVQIELARWSISTGRPGMFGYDEVPPRIAGRSWASYIVLLMFFQFMASQAGVVGSAALAMSMLLPFGGDPMSPLSMGIWVWIFIVIAIIIHQINKYELIEVISTFLVVVVTFLIVAMVFGIQFTQFAWTGAELADGMRFRIAAGSMGVALSMFGLTGVGAGEISGYSFWVVEKGYAAWTGPNDGSDEWAARARGWISVMKKDAWIAWVIYTMSTAAFYMLGATVLYKQGLEVRGNELIATISRIFTDTIGSWVGPVFLVFAAIALYKTILANVPGLARQTSASLAVFGVYKWTDARRRNFVMRLLMIIMPVSWGLLATVVAQPLALVILGGTLNAIYLMVVAVATVYLSFTETDKRIKDGNVFMIYLIISAVAIFAVGAIGLYDIIG